MQTSMYRRRPLITGRAFKRTHSRKKAALRSHRAGKAVR